MDLPYKKGPWEALLPWNINPKDLAGQDRMPLIPREDDEKLFIAMILDWPVVIYNNGFGLTFTHTARRGIFVCFKALYKKLPESEGFLTCNTILGLIGKLYEIEETLRSKRPGDNSDEAEFLADRKRLAEPILASLETYAKERILLHQGEVKLRKALNYILNQMQYLK
ncbi:MAG: hypothetical protein PHO09_10355, partial [Sphaerochaeta sp.]|nr:hypothetical protein [Sphaerochaeta sp.]